MRNYYEEVGNLKRFDLRNRDLALLASETAIDIRNYMDRKHQEDESIIYYLAKLLDEATQGESPLVKLPNNLLVLGYSIVGRENANKHYKEKNIEDLLVLQTKTISNELKDFKNLSKERLQGLINFCIRLSKEVMIYQQEYYCDQHRLVA